MSSSTIIRAAKLAEQAYAMYMPVSLYPATQEKIDALVPLLQSFAAEENDRLLDGLREIERLSSVGLGFSGKGEYLEEIAVRARALLAAHPAGKVAECNACGGTGHQGGFMQAGPCTVCSQTGVVTTSPTPQEADSAACPHCGSLKDTWFDRSYCVDSQGNQVEGPCYRCADCGKVR